MNSISSESQDIPNLTHQQSLTILNPLNLETTSISSLGDFSDSAGSFFSVMFVVRSL